MKKTSCILPALVVALGCLSSSSHAQVVLMGNSPPSNDGTGNIISATLWKAVSFTMPAQDYDVTSVDLRLANYNTTAGDNPVVGFFADASGHPDDATQIVALSNPASSSD